MSLDLKRDGISVLVGLLLGGALVPLAIVGAPPEWRGPWLAWVVGGLSIVLVVALRWPRSGQRP
jgi:hypothetical protein